MVVVAAVVVKVAVVHTVLVVVVVVKVVKVEQYTIVYNLLLAFGGGVDVFDGWSHCADKFGGYCDED